MKADVCSRSCSARLHPHWCRGRAGDDRDCRHPYHGLGVTFAVADVFAWSTSQRFDVVFFSAWLSHVPTNRFDEFWVLLRTLLADEGRVTFIDEHTEDFGKERYVASAGEIVPADAWATAPSFVL